MRPSPLGSAVKLRYSELSQEIAELAMRVIGRPVIGAAELDDMRDATTSCASTCGRCSTRSPPGTSQIQRNLIAERILGLPKGR